MSTGNWHRARVVARSLFAWAACLAGTAVLAGGFPDKPIRLIVPFPPGGPTDFVARPLAQFMGETLKQQVVVDNRAGAAGAIGADFVAKASADGYTLLMATVGTQAINPALYKKTLKYDPVKDFTPIALVAAAPITLVVNPSVKANSVAEFIALAKAKPGALNFGTAGSGTPGHLTGEMFRVATGTDLKHVPYKGSAPALTDLIGGQIEAMFDPLQSVLPFVKAGKLRLLAVSSAERSSVVPDTPTFAESGLKGFEATAWWGVLAPANLPPDIAAKLNAVIDRVANSAAFRKVLEPRGVQVLGGTQDEFARFQKQELVKWGKAVHDSGAAVD